jgi:hypothetical protein
MANIGVHVDLADAVSGHQSNVVFEEPVSPLAGCREDWRPGQYVMLATPSAGGAEGLQAMVLKVFQTELRNEAPRCLIHPRQHLPNHTGSIYIVNQRYDIESDAFYMPPSHAPATIHITVLPQPQHLHALAAPWHQRSSIFNQDSNILGLGLRNPPEPTATPPPLPLTPPPPLPAPPSTPASPFIQRPVSPTPYMQPKIPLAHCSQAAGSSRLLLECKGNKVQG